VNEEESFLAAISEDVKLHAYDPSWPAAFTAERERLAALLPGFFIEIQHIGSTAVPGLAAKPIIDVLAAERHSADREAYTNAKTEFVRSVLESV
jgi:GrpB-like predicted nucleotidyltransferase (UPF0157 family)